MSLRQSIFTPPTRLPLTLSDAKEHLRLLSDDSDQRVLDCIRAARDYVESSTGRSLITTTHRLTGDMFAFWLNRYQPIEIPKTPVQSVVFKYYDSFNAQQTFTSYEIYRYGDLNVLLRPLWNTAWPDIYRRADAVQIDYVAGYGDDHSAVPGLVKQILRLLVGHFFEQRDAVIVGTIQGEMSFGIKALIGQLRRGDFVCA